MWRVRWTSQRLPHTAQPGHNLSPREGGKFAWGSAATPDLTTSPSKSGQRENPFVIMMISGDWLEKLSSCGKGKKRRRFLQYWFFLPWGGAHVSQEEGEAGLPLAEVIWIIFLRDFPENHPGQQSSQVASYSEGTVPRDSLMRWPKPEFCSKVINWAINYLSFLDPLRRHWPLLGGRLAPMLMWSRWFESQTRRGPFLGGERGKRMVQCWA